MQTYVCIVSFQEAVRSFGLMHGDPIRELDKPGVFYSPAFPPNDDRRDAVILADEATGER